MTKPLKKHIEIDLETLLRALEDSSENPNCYQWTGFIRAKFSEYGRSFVTVPIRNKGAVRVISETVQTI